MEASKMVENHSKEENFRERGRKPNIPKKKAGLGSEQHLEERDRKEKAMKS